MIYSRASYVDRVEITSFGRNIEEDVTLMLIALRDIKQSMVEYCSATYEINWRIRPQATSVIDSNGDRVEWCKLQYVDDRWIYCHNDVCMRFTRDELKTSILYVRNGDEHVSIEKLLKTIISILVGVGIPEQYLFSRKQREFLIKEQQCPTTSQSRMHTFSSATSAARRADSISQDVGTSAWSFRMMTWPSA